LTVCFYPIPALHFAENFAALPALWRGKCSISKIGLFVNRGRKLNTKLDLAQLSEIAVISLTIPNGKTAGETTPRRVDAQLPVVIGFAAAPVPHFMASARIYGIFAIMAHNFKWHTMRILRISAKFDKALKRSAT